MSGGTGESARASARAEAAENETLEALRHKVMLLQSKVNSEERARTQAQDKCVSLAEQLLEKEASLQKVQAEADTEKASGRRNKKSDRLRELEAQVMSQTTKMRETEMDKDQVEIKLNQKEEESRIKARKISDLIFKISQVWSSGEGAKAVVAAVAAAVIVVVMIVSRRARSLTPSARSARSPLTPPCRHASEV